MQQTTSSWERGIEWRARQVEQDIMYRLYALNRGLSARIDMIFRSHTIRMRALASSRSVDCPLKGDRR